MGRHSSHHSSGHHSSSHHHSSGHSSEHSKKSHHSDSEKSDSDEKSSNDVEESGSTRKVGIFGRRFYLSHRTCTQVIVDGKPTEKCQDETSTFGILMIGMILMIILTLIDKKFFNKENF